MDDTTYSSNDNKQIFGQEGNASGEARSLNNSAAEYQRRGDLEHALEYYKRAVILLKELR